MEPSIIKEFATGLSGRLIGPAAPDYDEARSVWNGIIDKRPAMIVRCGDAGDVVRAVNFAREHNLLLSVKGGGHGVAGKSVCDDGLMIDLSDMNSVKVDPGMKIARVGPGARLRDLDAKTAEYGLVVPAGIVSDTGVAGLTLGGGLGYLSRKHGLTVDNLIAADIVTADGRQMRASDTENSDLFWALRGGGGNFGVVTSFEYRLHELGPEVLVAQVFHPIDATAEVLRFYSDFMASAPDELACYALVVNVPPVEPFPAEYQGRPAIALVACYSGSLEEGEKRLAVINDFGAPILAAVQAMPFTALQQSFDAGTPVGMRYYWKGHYFEEINDEAADAFARMTAELPGAFSIVGFEPMGGAINRVDASATAFPQRKANFALGVWSGWESPEDDERAIAWTRALHTAMTPYAAGGVYANYLDHDDDAQVTAAFGGNYERLRQIKKKYDPDNLFRLNQNIKPGQ